MKLSACPGSLNYSSENSESKLYSRMKQREKANYTSLDLLGFNAVDDRIHKRWEKEVDVDRDAHRDVDHMRSMSPNL